MKRKRCVAAFAVLIVLTLFFFLLNICIGSVGIPFTEIPKLIIEGEKGDATYREILMEIRMPRAFGTVILGGALALSGYLLQTFFHNPIASPFTLTDRCADDGCIPWVCRTAQFMDADYGGLCRLHALHGICPSYGEGDRPDVHADCKWSYDRIYLFGCHGFYRHVCG